MPRCLIGYGRVWGPFLGRFGPLTHTALASSIILLDARFLRLVPLSK